MSTGPVRLYGHCGCRQAHCALPPWTKEGLALMEGAYLRFGPDEKGCYRGDKMSR
mgnify:CR=1 FL=1|jgi:hypothetical protein